ncbi:hypothetical protein [Rugosimonospora acidiphila]|uniref:hypothetical protein n=1 Tax=Rugosimonospora acidiphila TaxID=556531 RepID=UPI0031EF64A6
MTRLRVRSVFAKLQVRSRVQLTNLLRDGSPRGRATRDDGTIRRPRTPVDRLRAISQSRP